jgi:hypothetical protein
MKRNKKAASPEEWLKVLAGLVLALAATAVARVRAWRPGPALATSCVTLRALSLAGPAA